MEGLNNVPVSRRGSRLVMHHERCWKQYNLYNLCIQKQIPVPTSNQERERHKEAVLWAACTGGQQDPVMTDSAGTGKENKGLVKRKSKKATKKTRQEPRKSRGHGDGESREGEG